MFVNTEGRRKRNDVLLHPALHGCTYWVPRWNPTLLPPGSTPESLERKGFGTKEQYGAARGCGCWMDPTGAVGGGGNWPSLGSKATWSVPQAPSPAGTGLPSAPSALCQHGARGQLSLAAGADPAEPPCLASLPGKELPRHFLAAAVRTTISRGSMGAPFLLREGAVPFPAKMQPRS